LPAVSDAGPLIHLAQVGRLNLLKQIFGKVTIVRSVKHEVVDEGIRLSHPDAVLVKNAMVEGWITVVTPTSRLLRRAKRLARQEKLSLSDSQTLLVAKTLTQSLLTDEKPLSILGRMYGLGVWNTWTVLLEALRAGFIGKVEIHAAINELGQKRHKLSARRAEEILRIADRLAPSDT